MYSHNPYIRISFRDEGGVLAGSRCTIYTVDENSCIQLIVSCNDQIPYLNLKIMCCVSIIPLLAILLFIYHVIVSKQKNKNKNKLLYMIVISVELFSLPTFHSGFIVTPIAHMSQFSSGVRFCCILHMSIACVKVFRIIYEFGILRLTFHRKSS